ncbi:AMP-binding protein, partial [Streptomyces lasiicapitis]|uniref:AMP-binding protein n=1 Tax=Streptomyces lasiicapitis TaxID=1923961 RepID=UPI0036941134
MAITGSDSAFTGSDSALTGSEGVLTGPEGAHAHAHARAEHRQRRAAPAAGTSAPPRAGTSAVLTDLFEAQAALHPDRTALTCGGEHLDYATLNARANRLAHALLARGAVTE